jgi:hypothetical protein
MCLADQAIRLIEQHGLTGLCETDGCPCIHFCVHRCDVSISCHKSAHTIRVSSRSGDYSTEDLERVLQVVKREFNKVFGYPPDEYKFEVALE